jgi:hypothetical protein
VHAEHRYTITCNSPAPHATALFSLVLTSLALWWPQQELCPSQANR